MTDVAVVTGAGRGIGAGLARALSERGMHVVVTDVDAATATRTAEGLPGPATALPLDVRDAGAHRAVAAAAADLGEVRVWVNNAGVLSTASVWDATDAEVTSTIEINTLGVVHGCRAAVDVMRRGDILNVVSLSGLGPTPGLAIYGASKAAALSFVQALHTELGGARRPIRCLALCPDAVSTDLLRAVSDRPSSALLFTGPRVLGVDEVVAAGIAMLDGKRQLKVLPTWRGWLTRTQSVLPAVARTLTPMVARAGERRRPGG